MPLHFYVVSLFPELLHNFWSHALIGRAIQSGLIVAESVNPREFTHDRHHTVDDRPYGGGDGMIMMFEPLKCAINAIKQKITIGPPQIEGSESRDREPFCVLLSPQGQKLSFALSQTLSRKKNLVLVCGRYGGMDQRFINSCIDCEVSVGDYVLSGGELPACLLMESIVRHVPGVLGNEISAQSDSFTDGLLEGPQFTRPRECLGLRVPAVLLSGNHREIYLWRQALSIIKTFQLRPDLFTNGPTRELQLAKKVARSLSAEDILACGLDHHVIESLMALTTDSQHANKNFSTSNNAGSSDEHN